MTITAYRGADTTDGAWWTATAICDNGCRRQITLSMLSLGGEHVVVDRVREQLRHRDGWSADLLGLAEDMRATVSDICRACVLERAGWQGQRAEQETRRPLHHQLEWDPDRNPAGGWVCRTCGETNTARFNEQCPWDEGLRVAREVLEDSRRGVISVDEARAASGLPPQSPYFDTFADGAVLGDAWHQGAGNTLVAPGTDPWLQIPGETPQHRLDRLRQWLAKLTDAVAEHNQLHQELALAVEDAAITAARVEPCGVCGGDGERCRARWISNGGPGVKCCPDCTHGRE